MSSLSADSLPIALSDHFALMVAAHSERFFRAAHDQAKQHGRGAMCIRFRNVQQALNITGELPVFYAAGASVEEYATPDTLAKVRHYDMDKEFVFVQIFDEQDFQTSYIFNKNEKDFHKKHNVKLPPSMVIEGKAPPAKRKGDCDTYMCAMCHAKFQAGEDDSVTVHCSRCKLICYCSNHCMVEHRSIHLEHCTG
jgi:hypothetical protein